MPTRHRADGSAHRVVRARRGAAGRVADGTSEGLGGQLAIDSSALVCQPVHGDVTPLLVTRNRIFW